MSSSERFIPYRRDDIVTMCIQDKGLSDSEVKAFGDFCKILTALFHFELHENLELLKNYYAPFNPDRDTKLLGDQEGKADAKEKLEKELKVILEKANFERISENDLQDALECESLFKVKLQVDFNDFEEVLFFRRGVSNRTETVSTWFGLRKKEIQLQVYDRVLVYVRFKNQEYFDEIDKNDLFFQPGSTLIKLFRNVPKNDIEMLFPNTEVRMKPIDKLLIGVPTAVGGVFMLVTKLGGTLLLMFSVLAFWLGFRDTPAEMDQAALVALAIGFGTLGGFLWRQFSKYKNRKIQFMKQLAENLYFKNLDNNSGVFHHLIDSAEEEECKETMLAYYHLLKSKKLMSGKELDETIEEWFYKTHSCSLDFEMNDALQKLLRLKLISEENGKYRAHNINEANARLDALWDNYFKF